MKIGCLTFHNSSNYGSVLQTYALQQIVQSLGYEYEIIDYTTPEKFKFDSLLRKHKESSWKAYTYKLVSFTYNYFKKQKFVSFSNRYLKVAFPRYRDLKDLDNIKDTYDYYICGSDQVWNATMVRFDSAYFLSFVQNTNKKIAYAASFGRVETTNADCMFYKKQLATFEKISVREQSAQQTVLECANKKAELVLDPTLLLTSQQWSELSYGQKVSNEPYILTYCLSANSEMQAFIRKLSSQTGYKVIGISRGVIPMMKEGAYAIPSPLEFVSLFASASYIVTNSFHGTAFSTNLNRNFFTFIKGDKTSATNSRIVDFLESVGLQDRLRTTCLSGIIELGSPNYRKVNVILDEKREKSVEFLKQALNN